MHVYHLCQFIAIIILLVNIFSGYFPLYTFLRLSLARVVYGISISDLARRQTPYTLRLKHDKSTTYTLLRPFIAILRPWKYDGTFSIVKLLLFCMQVGIGFGKLLLLY